MLVHGGPGLDHHLLLPLAEALCSVGTARLVDLPGHGARAEGDTRLPGLAQVEARTARGLQRGDDGRPWILVGHSLGAWLTRELARHGSVSPDAMVWICPPVAGAAPGPTAVRRAERLVAAPVDASTARAEVEAHLRSELGGALPAHVTDLLRRSHLRSPREYGPLLRNLHRRLRAPLREARAQCPTLILAASEDRTTPAARIAELAAKTPGARFDVLDGLGHYPFLQDAEAVAAPIRELVVGLSRPDAPRGRAPTGP